MSDEMAMMPEQKPGGAGKLLLLAVGAVAVLGGLFALGLWPRLEGQQELKRIHQETVGAVPVVQTIQALPADHGESVALPGNIGAIQYTTIYARVDGYLKSRMVDIGDHVKTGQLLAQIDTPTVDEQLMMARAELDKAKAELLSAKAQLLQAQADDKTAIANVDKAKANVDYTTVTAKRYESLCSRGAVSQQNRDEKVRSLETTTAELEAKKADKEAADAKVKAATSQVEAAKAQVASSSADVKRLEYQQGFQKVIAPFDGIITYRKVDPGALITQGSGSTNLELFQMAKIDRLRIYVSVPQRVARYLKNGLKAQVDVPEFPDRKFEGIVTNVSGALDPNTRTRQTEIQMSNPDGALLPGMYAEVKLTAIRETPWIRVAGTCLVAKPEGQFVVIVKDGKAHFQPIVIGRDFGNEVEIRSGLAGHELVIVSPNDDLREGDPVQPEPAKTGV